MDLKSIFEKDGRLSEAIGNYCFRRSQLDMAHDVAQACENRCQAIIEAGPGTGKTFAYLVPLLLAQQRVVISTSTRGLQDQLFWTDIEQLKKALGMDADVRMLKGRSNYICKLRLAQAVRQGELDLTAPDKTKRARQDASELKAIQKHMAANPASGDIAQIKGVGRNSRVWRMVTSTTDNCTERDCEHYDDCFVYKARNQAQDCQIVVANHALVLADMALRIRGIESSSLLGKRDAIVFDEAHAVPDQLIESLAEAIDTNSILDGVEQAANSKPDAGVNPKVLQDLEDIAQAVQKAFSSLPGKPDLDGQTIFWDDAIGESPQFAKALSKLRSKLAQLAEHCPKDMHGNQFNAFVEAMKRHASMLDDIIKNDPGPRAWITKNKDHFVLYVVPQDYVANFATHVLADRAVVFTSASLSLDGNFNHFIERLELSADIQQQYASPFDFKKNTRLLLAGRSPRKAPEDEFDQCVADMAADLIRANNGRAMVLTSTRRSMHKIRHKLDNLLKGKYEVMMQNEGTPEHLVEKLKQVSSPARVLVGTRTFWQGVDIQGPALSLVVIDRIPFKNFRDPVLNLQAENLAGGNDDKFEKIMLPEATNLLKQAVGRLVRSETDCGLVAICDSRMFEMPYGTRIKDSLPPMPSLSELDKAVDYLQKLDQ